MSHCPQTSRLEIIADSDPTLLARVCGIFGGLCLIPARVESVAVAGSDSLHITVHIQSGTARQLDLIQRKLAQMTSVQRVCFRASDGALGDVPRRESDALEDRKGRR